MDSSEFFKDIPEFEDRYQVSNKGNVRSLGNSKSRKEKILKSSLNSRGYLTVHLKSKTYQVHQLVAVAFLNHTFCGYKKVVDHIDNVKTNNNVENLRIISQRENVCKAKKNKAGIKKNDKNWSVTVTFCSISSEEKAICFRNELIDFYEKIKNNL
jgi:hypothetical protein